MFVSSLLSLILSKCWKLPFLWLKGDNNYWQLNAVKCNLIELTSGCVPYKGLQYCYAHVPVCSPMSKFLHAQWCFVRHLCQCMLQGSAPPCILHCLFMHLHQCMHGASIGKPVQSAVFWCPRVRGSLVFFVVPFYIQTQFLGCSPPTLHFFPLYMYYISVMGALLPFCLRTHGWVARIY